MKRKYATREHLLSFARSDRKRDRVIEEAVINRLIGDKFEIVMAFPQGHTGTIRCLVAVSDKPGDCRMLDLSASEFTSLPEEP